MNDAPADTLRPTYLDLTFRQAVASVSPDALNAESMPVRVVLHALRVLAKRRGLAS